MLNDSFAGRRGRATSVEGDRRVCGYSSADGDAVCAVGRYVKMGRGSCSGVANDMLGLGFCSAVLNDMLGLGSRS